jgi:hypothetical protein
MRSSLMTTATKIFSVEWNQNVAAVQNQLLPAATHFVFPDLPEVFSDEDRVNFASITDPNQRIHTVATCQHENAESLLNSVSNVEPGSKILLVGGNNRGPKTMSSIDAARILGNEKENILWGVANPNDPKSFDTFEKKLESGMSGFITQPLLSSYATDTMQMYRDCATTDVTILAGLAFPKTKRGLRFWAKLLDQEGELEKDPLFQSHLAYFSQPFVTPIAWVGRELQDLLLVNNANNSCIDGIHFMPLKNTDDLCNIFQSLNNAHRSSSDKGVC